MICCSYRADFTPRPMEMQLESGFIYSARRETKALRARRSKPIDFRHKRLAFAGTATGTAQKLKAGGGPVKSPVCSSGLSDHLLLYLGHYVLKVYRNVLKLDSAPDYIVVI